MSIVLYPRQGFLQVKNKGSVQAVQNRKVTVYYDQRPSECLSYELIPILNLSQSEYQQYAGDGDGDDQGEVVLLDSRILTLSKRKKKTSGDPLLPSKIPFTPLTRLTCSGITQVTFHGDAHLLDSAVLTIEGSNTSHIQLNHATIDTLYVILKGNAKLTLSNCSIGHFKLQMTQKATAICNRLPLTSFRCRRSKTARLLSLPNANLVSTCNSARSCHWSATTGVTKTILFQDPSLPTSTSRGQKRPRNEVNDDDDDDDDKEGGGHEVFSLADIERIILPSDSHRRKRQRIA